MSQDAGQSARDGDQRASATSHSFEWASIVSPASRTRSWIAMAVAATVVLLASAALIALLGNDRSSDHGRLGALTTPTRVTVPVPSPTVSATATEQVVPPSATPTRTPVPGPPYTVHVTADYVPWPPRVDHLVEMSDLIVVGRIVEVLPARWTTPDGVRPVDPFAMERQYTIITPAVLEIEEVLFDRSDLDLDGARVIVATEGGHVGNDSVQFEQPLETGVRLVSVLAPYKDYSGEPVMLFEVRVWYPHTRYTLTTDGHAVPAISIWESRPTDELLNEIRAYVAGEPWRRPDQHGQCMPEDVPGVVARFVGAFNLGDGDALGQLFPSTDHPGELVEPYAEGGMQVFYGYAMTGADTFDGHKDTVIEHLLRRQSAGERWYVQDLVYSVNLDEALQMPDVTRGTVQFIREADDLPTVTMLADMWFNCMDSTMLDVLVWEEQSAVAMGSLIGSDHDVFPSWPARIVAGLPSRMSVSGTGWRLAWLDGQAVEAPPNQRLAVSNGSVFGNAGCDSYTAPMRSIAEGHIALDLIQRWDSHCDDPAIEELEERFFPALEAVSTYRIVDDRLVFRNAAHEVVMVLERD